MLIKLIATSGPMSNPYCPLKVDTPSGIVYKLALFKYTKGAKKSFHEKTN